MRREDDRRNNELVKIGHFYVEKGNLYSAEIEAALKENRVKIQNRTPSHALFVPRLIQSPELEELTGGEVIWNSIDDSISVIYYSFQGAAVVYSEAIPKNDFSSERGEA